MNYQEKYMLRCIELAKLGFGNVAPNPMVGCVIVCDDKIIGEGFHQKYGHHHAEVNAIQSVQNQDLLKKSTLFVSLEPCAHYGKTPPCANLIIEKQIPNVVIGCVDSFSEVSGKGIELLKNSGINVTVGVLEKESFDLNKRFFTFHNKKHPYIILKWAETKDGFIDRLRGNHNTDNWITTPESKKLVHKWRSEEDAILIGTNTAINDNPQLNVREWKGKNPIRVVLDIQNRLPRTLHVFDQTTPTLVFNSVHEHETKNLTYIKLNPTQSILPQLINELYHRKVQSVIVEGGTMLLQSFIDENLWDEARVFIGNKTFEKGLSAPIFKGKIQSKELINSDELTIYTQLDLT